MSSKTLILCDFDGTVSLKDTVNRLIRSHITSPEWRYHFKRYLLGDIGSKAVYEAVAPIMSMTPAQLRRFVADHAQLDPAFPAFLQWASDRNIDVKIVSDGFDATIATLFAAHAIDDVPVLTNTLILEECGRVGIGTPNANPSCGHCATCKLTIVNRLKKEYDRIILIGDGESDRHAAEAVDMVLALKDLYIYCARKGIPAVHVKDFSEVPFLLDRRIDAVAFDMDGTLVDSVDSITESFNHMFSRLGYPAMTRDEVVRKTSISLIDFVGGFLKPEETRLGIEIFRDYYDTIYLEKTTVMPGAAEMLRILNGSRITGVVTNKRGSYARRLADHLGITNGMHRIIGAQDGFSPKPSGEMLEEFVRSAGVQPENTIYVGDTPLDVEAAANAGIDTYAVAGDVYSAEELALCRPRRVLRNLSELPAALEPLV